MLFKEFATHLSAIEATPSRLLITQELATLFKKGTPEEVAMMAYMFLGSVAPPYEQKVFGIAEKLMVKAIAASFSAPEQQVKKEAEKEGDLGIVAEKLRTQSQFLFAPRGDLTITEVFVAFESITQAGGTGSQDTKRGYIADLLQRGDSLSVRYIVRMLLSTMRLGFSAMTILDAYSWMLTGNKQHRKIIERAYNVRPDVGYIGRKIRERGLKGISHVLPEVGVPVLMARAERVALPKDIIEKIGECAVEPKYDGFRLQLHYKKGAFVRLFTRSMEEVSHMYPDIISSAQNELSCRDCIIEGEAVGYNPKTGEYLPFQETVQRKRKYDIVSLSRSIPLRLFAFDLLFINGKSSIDVPYLSRREMLVGMLPSSNERIVATSMEKVGKTDRLVKLFNTYTTEGLEGIMAKRLDGVYEAGARGWNWIKFKKSYAGSINDTVDCVVMGLFSGKGKRTSFGIGAFLVGVYNDERESYETVAKIGTGLTDDEWREMKKRADTFVVKEKPSSYSVNKTLTPDLWVRPAIVVEIRADEITRSPAHSCGLALRFPRLERFRDDKKPVDATKQAELERLFALQRK